MTEQQRASQQKLHYAINKAADEYGKPLAPGLAMFIATKLIEDTPQLLDAIASAAEGRVK